MSENKIDRINISEEQGVVTEKQETETAKQVDFVETTVKNVPVDFKDKTGKKATFNGKKVCPVDDWKVVGWIYKSSSDKTLKIVIKDSEGKNKTLGIFFPQQISPLFAGEIRAIPIKYNEKPKEEPKEEKKEVDEGSEKNG